MPLAGKEIKKDAASRAFLQSASATSKSSLMRRHGILLVCPETAVAFRDKCGLLLIDPGLVLETQVHTREHLSPSAASVRHPCRITCFEKLTREIACRRTKGTECLQAAVLRHRSLVTRAKAQPTLSFAEETSSWEPPSRTLQQLS